jgi:hypothetical protein
MLYRVWKSSVPTAARLWNQPASIGAIRQVLLDKLAPHLTAPRVLRLIAQYLKRCAERGGLFWEATQGLALSRQEKLGVSCRVKVPVG